MDIQYSLSDVDSETKLLYRIHLIKLPYYLIMDLLRYGVLDEDTEKGSE